MKRRTNKQKKQKILERRFQVTQLYLKGHLISDISKDLKVAIGLVSEDIQAVEAMWLEASISTFDLKRAKELAKIDHLEKTYWEAWEASKQAKVSKTKKQTDNGVETTDKEENVYGVAAFLKGVSDCIDKRIRLLGLDEPSKIEWVNTLPEGHDQADVRKQFTDLLMRAKARQEQYKEV